MNKVIEWIRRFWEQRKAPEPSPHPDTSHSLQLARARAVLYLGLVACGTAEASHRDATVEAGVVDAAPAQPSPQPETTVPAQAPFGRPLRLPSKLRSVPGPTPIVAPFAVGPDLPTSVRRF